MMATALASLLGEYGQVMTPEIADFGRLAAAVQHERHNLGASDRDEITRSTALWAVSSLDKRIADALELGGVHLSDLAQLLALRSVPAGSHLGEAVLDTDFEDALRRYLEFIPRETAIELPDIGLAIIRSAASGLGSLLSSRLEELGIAYPPVLAALERAVVETSGRPGATVRKPVRSAAAAGGAQVSEAPRIGFSSSVRDLQSVISGPTTASYIAQRLGANHDYAGGALGVSPLRIDEGERQPLALWLDRVAELYEPRELAASADGVVDGRMLILGLVELDPILREDLEKSGIRDRLRAETSVHPRTTPAPDTAGLVDADPLIGYAPDLVSDRRPARAEDDLLDVEDDVRTLARLLIARTTDPPLAIGLFGSWGAGKSFFVQRLRTCIQEMTDDAVKNSSLGATYCEHVVSVSFNAWHYLDADLWAGLTSHIYRSIAAVEGAGESLRTAWLDKLVSTAGRRDTARIRVNAAERQLDELEPELDRRNKALEQLRADPLNPGATLATAFGVLAETTGLDQASPADTELETLTKDAAFGSGVLAAGFTRSRKRPWLALAVIAAALVVVGALFLTGQLSAAAAAISSFTTVVVTVTVAIVNGVRNVRVKREQMDAIAERKARELDASVAALRVQRNQAQAERDAAAGDLRSLQDAGLVGRYLSDRAQSAAYRDRLGLVSLIREDLEQLARALDPNSSDSVDARIERIVLYIDDLDRCTPDRVVEVLQAVHLLLAFPLFVVVVAVEHRWLLACLQLHYRKMLGDDDQAVNRMREWELTPADYLEKIFQIPLNLRPMSAEGFGRLVDSLAPVRREATATTAGESSTTMTAGTPDTAGTSSGSAEPTISPSTRTTPTAPLSVFEEAVSGRLLHVAFNSTGRRLAVVTTDGLWLWDRGRDRLTRLLDNQIASVSARADGDVVVAVGPDGAVQVIDLQIRQHRSEDQPELRGPMWIAPVTYQRVLLFDELDPFLGQYHDPNLDPGPVELRAVFATDGRVTTQSRRSVLTRQVKEDGTFSTLHEFSANLVAVSSLGELLVGGDTELYRPDGATGREPGRFGSALVQADHPELNAARSSQGWWIRGDSGRLAFWADQERSLAESTFQPGWWLHARQESSWVVGWGKQGFDVFDRSGVRFRMQGPAVAGVAVSPLGSIVATVSAQGLLVLWRVTGSTVPERASQLEFESHEVAFLKTLAPIVVTPRQAKRVVNLFRLIRASARGRSMLADPITGDYRVALTMLTIAVCKPEDAAGLFKSIKASESDADVPLRSALPAAMWQPEGPLAALVQIAGFGDAALSTCQQWARTIERYYIDPHDAAEGPVTLV